MLNRDLLRKKRNELRLTMRDMSALMNCKSACVYFRLEHGQAGGTVRQLRMLSEILGVSVEELMGSGAGLNSAPSQETPR